MTHTFTIVGEPMGKQRPRFSRAGGFVRTHTPQQTANYEQWVRLSYMQQGGTKPFPDDAPLAVTIKAYFKIPKSASKRRAALMRQDAIRPTKKPDCDNICKIVLDALNGLAYKDDAAVVAADVEKHYAPDGEPKVVVTIEEIET